MSTYKTSGIAIKSTRLGEADKIITFLTTEGKLSAVAKGVRRPSSKFGGRLEPGNDLDLVFAKGRNIDTVAQVQIKTVRPWLRGDLDRLEAAYIMMETADKMTTEKAHDDRLLGLLAAGLDRLKDEARPPLLLAAFDIKTLAMTGFLPYLSACVVCGANNKLHRLGLPEGGLVCDDCYQEGPAVGLGAEEKELIKKLLTVRLTDLDGVKADSSLVEKVRKIIWSHMAYHVRADFKARPEKGQYDA